MIYTDNSETLKNALAKIAELEHENTMLIGEAEELKAINDYFLKSKEALREKLAIAIEALEKVIKYCGCGYADDVATEALNKIKGE